MRKNKFNPRDPMICSCNEVPLSAIHAAIDSGACNLAQIFDATWAGCGPCGGTCQPELARILTERLRTRPSEPSRSDPILHSDPRRS